MSVIDFPSSPAPPAGAAAATRTDLQLAALYLRARLAILACDLARQDNALSDEVIEISLGCDHILEMLR